MKNLLTAAIILCGSFAVLDSTFSQTWTPTSSPSVNWGAIASSADGSKLIATFVLWKFCISTNGGAAWTTNTQPVYGSGVTFSSVALSADGGEIVGVAGTACFVSTNLGNTWSSNNVTGATVLSSVAMSEDGSKLVAVSGQGGAPLNQAVNGPICISTNSGATWTQTMAPTNDWVSVASSADGSKLVAAVHNNNQYSPSGNFIYISTNSGTSWILSEAPTNIPWWSVASSADGSKVVAASALVFTAPMMFGSVFTSTDFGMTWNSNNVPAANWLGVASSADGTKLVAGAESSTTTNNFIFSSTNSGASWVSNNAPNIQFWGRFASSADGNKIIAIPLLASTNIFILQDTPTPQLNITSSATNFVLSWPIPSTNFVAQQSPDLISWSSIPNTPTLNLTNLNNELSLSPTNNTGFFRLVTP